ncbi:centromere protein F-like [Mytilus trossulus]|uniref:centromere protein F-like n=1 Tax=Mytilus trossulus TaxID=6551 RepID=UPI0030068C85
MKSLYIVLDTGMDHVDMEFLEDDGDNILKSRKKAKKKSLKLRCKRKKKAKYKGEQKRMTGVINLETKEERVDKILETEEERVDEISETEEKRVDEILETEEKRVDEILETEEKRVDEILETEEESVEEISETVEKRVDEILETEEKRVDEILETEEKRVDEILETEEKRVEENSETKEKRVDEILETEEKRVDEILETQEKRVEEILETKEERVEEISEIEEKRVEEILEAKEKRFDEILETEEKRVEENSETKEESVEEISETEEERVDEILETEEERIEEILEVVEKRVDEILETEEKRVEENSETKEERVEEILETKEKRVDEILETEEKRVDEILETEEERVEEILETVEKRVDEILETEEKIVEENSETKEERVEEILETEEKRVDEILETEEKREEEISETEEKRVEEKSGTEEERVEEIISDNLKLRYKRRKTAKYKGGQKRMKGVINLETEEKRVEEISGTEEERVEEIISDNLKLRYKRRKTAKYKGGQKRMKGVINLETEEKSVEEISETEEEKVEEISETEEKRVEEISGTEEERVEEIISANLKLRCKRRKKAKYKGGQKRMKGVINLETEEERVEEISETEEERVEEILETEEERVEEIIMDSFDEDDRVKDPDYKYIEESDETDDSEIFEWNAENINQVMEEAENQYVETDEEREEMHIEPQNKEADNEAEEMHIEPQNKEADNEAEEMHIEPQNKETADQVVEIDNETEKRNAFEAKSSDLNLDELPCKRVLDDTDCLFDATYPKVFIKVFKKQNTKSKHNRVYDCIHACIFCNKLFTNIQSHLENKHSNKMKEITELKKHVKEANEEEKKNLKKSLSLKLNLLRNKGDNIHNMKVLKHKVGELILPRRTSTGKFVLNEYGPCPNCYEWMILNISITNHQKTCPAKTQHDYHKGSTMVQVGILTGKVQYKGSHRLLKEVFPIMKKDDITDVAIKDPLILALGDVWLMKNVDNKRKRKYYASYHMRLASRLISAFRKLSANKDNTTMSKMLSPENFDNVAKCALEICTDKDGELKHPSTAVKSGFDIMRMVSSKLGISIKERDETMKKEASDFLFLMKMEWSIRVNKLARSILSERQFNNKKELPHPEDIANFASFLIKECQSLDIDPATADGNTFRQTAMLVQTRLLLYNRRRPGELEAMSLECYRKRSTSVSETDISLRQQLTTLEKKMLQTQELVELRGKNGTRVPVILPPEVVPSIEFLANKIVREKAGIKEENMYLFANTALDVVRAGDSLEQLKTQCGSLKYPERIYATNLRKHCATIAQVIGLTDHELKYLCRHLGHTVQVHEMHYRSTSGLIERLEIAKLMLMQENNMVGKFQGKTLKDITFEEIMQKEENEEEVQREEPVSLEDTGMDHVDMEFLEDDGDNILKSRKKAKKSTRKKWTTTEIQELEKYMPQYFKKDDNPKRTCPTRAECLRAVKLSEENGGELFKRTWETIKKKVYNSVIKN